MESDVSALVRDAIARSGLTPSEVAARAGVSGSTVSRVVHGHVSPSVNTLADILVACGLQMNLRAETPSDPDASAAARLLLDDTYHGDEHRLAPWADRLERWVGQDPVATVREAARHSGVTHRPGAVLLRGEVTVGRLASAGTASEQQWALSGAAGLTLPAFNQAAPPVTVLWCPDPRQVHQLLASAPLQPVTAPHRASLVIAPATADVFDGAFEHDRITYAAPVQVAIDALSVGGPTGDAALKEIQSW